MLQRAGGSLAGVEDGGLEGEDRSVWHMWVAVGGEEEGGRMMVDVIVCVGGGITAHNLLSRHPNLLLVKKTNTSDSGRSPDQFDRVGFGATELNR